MPLEYLMNKHPCRNYLKLAAHVGSLLPLALLVWDLLNGSMINPIQEATQRSGRTAITLLGATLACTPVNIIFILRPVAALRKTFGRYTYLYAAIHMLLYVGLDYGFAWSQLLNNLSEQPYLWAALSAFIILSLLAATSFSWWMKILGRNWKRLHRLVYLAGVLAVIHYIWVVKGDLLHLSGNISRPAAYAVIITLLLAIRLPLIKRWRGILLRPKPDRQKERANPDQGAQE